ncbi:MAG: SDR family oxidoreductase [Christensenellales bacterium]|jgi:NAD(P)-dependent dehydrogenase (short-subunit alcohol dehydrogenase family)
MECPFPMDLSGKTAVVTGAGGVLCSMFSRVLAGCGAKVALLDINEDAARAVAEDICSNGGTAKAYKADVLDKANLDQVGLHTLADLGPCDILLNGAGGNNPRATTTNEYYFPGDIDSGAVSFFDLKPECVEFVLNLNFLGTFLPTQVFAAQMLGRKNCTIVNISSMNAFTPLTKIPAYSGAKAAISNFTQWLAVHFAKEGIRVNALAPGFFVTSQNRSLLFDSQGEPTPRTGKILAATPMGRFGEPEELVGTLQYLVNPVASGFVTGIVIPVDGGFSAYSGV